MDGRKTQYFSAPGRTELGGNHTDHQGGCVLASAVDRCMRAAAAPNGGSSIFVRSRGYAPFEVELDSLAPRPGEAGTPAALARGVAAGFRARGFDIGGFDAEITSEVPSGSGLSSSACFEVLMGTVMNGLFCGGKADFAEVAAIGRYAENEYFGKPCGLMDQMASAAGGIVFMDFARPHSPRVERIEYDFERSGFTLYIINTGGEHSGLGGEYASIPKEMGTVARELGCNLLGEACSAQFYRRLPELRASCGDRAVLRAMHFFSETERARAEAEALNRGDMAEFLHLVEDSGRSSWELLQNVILPGDPRRQEMAAALALCEKLLEGRGACRVHGGGFAGTVQAFVPSDGAESFRREMERVFGEGSCGPVRVRRRGGAMDEEAGKI